MERNIVELWNNQDLVSSFWKKAFEKLNQEYGSDVVYGKWEKLINRL